MSSQKGTTDTNPDMVTVDHVAHLTGKTPRTVRRWCRSGKVEAKKDTDNTWKIALESVPTDNTTSSGQDEANKADKTDALAGRLVDLARKNALLEERLSRALPSGEVDAELAKECVDLVRKIAQKPFARYLVPKDIRKKLLEKEEENGTN